MYTGTPKSTVTTNVRIRQANADGSTNPLGTTIGAIQPGQNFKADLLSPDGEWIRVTEVNGRTIQDLYNKPYGWSATDYLDYTVVTPPPPAISPVVHASMDFDLAAKTMVTTRRRQDGTSDVDRDPIA